MAIPDLTTIRRALKQYARRCAAVETRGRKRKLSKRAVLGIEKMRKKLYKTADGACELHWSDLMKAHRDAMPRASGLGRGGRQWAVGGGRGAGAEAVGGLPGGGCGAAGGGRGATGGRPGGGRRVVGERLGAVGRRPGGGWGASSQDGAGMAGQRVAGHGEAG